MRGELVSRRTFSFFEGIGTMTWSPLACGLLTGKYDDGVPLHSRAALKVTRRSDRNRRTSACFSSSQGYGWLKDKILSDEGRKQQSKLRELSMLATKFDCTLAQLAIGKRETRPSQRDASIITNVLSVKSNRRDSKSQKKLLQPL